MTISYTVSAEACRRDITCKTKFAFEAKQLERTSGSPHRSFLRGTLIAIPNAETGGEKIIRTTNNDNDSSNGSRANLCPGTLTKSLSSAVFF